MEESTPREKVLKKIRKALIARGDSSYLNVDLDKEVFEITDEEAEIRFAKKLTALNGNFIYCVDEEDLTIQIKELFVSKKWSSSFYKEEEIFYFLEKAGIKHQENTDTENTLVATALCECVVANTGSFFVSSAQNIGRNFFVNNDVLIIIAFTSQMVNTISEGFEFIKTKYEGSLPSFVSLISGPSKTADIEQQLVYGAHGAKELYFFLVEG